MAIERTFQITLQKKIAEQIHQTAKQVNVKPTELLLYYLVCGLRDHKIGARSIPVYQKILQKIQEEGITDEELARSIED